MSPYPAVTFDIERPSKMSRPHVYANAVRVTRPFFDAGRDASEAAFSAEASRYPVFRLRSGPVTPAPVS